MIGVVACYLAGLAAGAVLWTVSRSIFATDVFARVNYRQHRLPTAVGVLLPAWGRAGASVATCAR